MTKILTVVTFLLSGLAARSRQYDESTALPALSRHTSLLFITGKLSDFEDILGRPDVFYGFSLDAIRLAVAYKFTGPFKAYEKDHQTPMSRELKAEIQEIFLLNLTSYERRKKIGEFQDFEFGLYCRDEKWKHPMRTYTDTTTLYLDVPYSFKKPLSPELLSFFAKYCGTRELKFPRFFECDPFAGYESADIEKIEILEIYDVPGAMFPQHLDSFRDLRELKISIPERHPLVHACPEPKDAVYWPKLTLLSLKGCGLRKIGRRFLEALPRDAKLELSGEMTGHEVESMTVGEFLASRPSALCEGPCAVPEEEEIRGDADTTSYDDDSTDDGSMEEFSDEFHCIRSRGV